MPIDVKVPEMGESITEVEVSAVLKSKGDFVAMDESVVELESDKATVEVPAPAAGMLVEILVEEGAVLQVGDVLARIDASGAGAADSGQDAVSEQEAVASSGDAQTSGGTGPVMPAAQRAMRERGISEGTVQGSGPGGRVLKEDVPAAPTAPPQTSQASTPPSPSPQIPLPTPPAVPGGGREVRRKRMSPIRRRIAERLVFSQQNAALLTTFNEVDMTRVKALRKEHQESFVARYGVKLGFMSIFTKAAVEALQLIPEINAQIDGEEIVYHDYCDIGVAVGGGKGLVVPIIRNAEMLGFGELELTIADFAQRAQKNQLDLAELQRWGVRLVDEHAHHQSAPERGAGATRHPGPAGGDRWPGSGAAHDVCGPDL